MPTCALHLEFDLTDDQIDKLKVAGLKALSRRPVIVNVPEGEDQRAPVCAALGLSRDEIGSVQVTPVPMEDVKRLRGDEPI